MVAKVLEKVQGERRGHGKSHFVKTNRLQHGKWIDGGKEEIQGDHVAGQSKIKTD